MSEADPGTVRVRLGISYDGTEFLGWAIQADGRTVQGAIQAALATILRVDRVRLTVAGRTDAGVHACGQVAHVDIDRRRWIDLSPTLLRRLNGVLADDVRVTELDEAPAGFDARFSALWRAYEYRIVDEPYGAQPLQRRTTLAWSRRLDTGAMAAAAARLVGEHDFAAYCRYRPHTTTVRGLKELAVQRCDDAVLTVRARADAFCYSMVRSLVGALLAVGDGRHAVDWPVSLLTMTSRSNQVVVAPPHGLTLLKVGYPPDEELQVRAELTRALRNPPYVGS